jgi:hypothetical protein
LEKKEKWARIPHWRQQVCFGTKRMETKECFLSIHLVPRRSCDVEDEIMQCGFLLSAPNR